jgi:hypothetical protein
MPQAIHTKYIGPSATKSSRIKATCDAGSLTVGFHNVDAVDDADRYDQVAKMLAAKLGWNSDGMVSGGLPGNMGNCHVFTKRIR